MLEYQGHWIKVKVMCKNDYSLISTCYSFVCTYRLLIRSRSHIQVKVIHQGQCQIKVKIKLRSFLRRDTLTWVVCIWIKCILVGSFGYAKMSLYDRHLSLVLTLVLSLVLSALLASVSVDSSPINFQDGCLWYSLHLEVIAANMSNCSDLLW